MSFWRSFSWNSGSAINTILEKETFTLEELLNEDDILSELKAQNKKLIDYLSEAATLEKLMKYVIEEPSEDSDEKQFKYPYLCAEIICSNTWSIFEGLFNNEPLIALLFNFLDNEPPLHPVLSSYVNKVASYLLAKKNVQTVDILRAKENAIERFLVHINNPAIVDLLLKIVACDESDEEHKIVAWLCDCNLVPSLIAKLSKEHSADMHESVSQLLCDIIATSMQSQSASLVGSPLLSALEEEENVKKLLAHVLSDGAKSSVLLFGIGVVIDLVRRAGSETYDDTSSVESLPPILRLLATDIGKFKDMIAAEDEDTMLTTAGELSPPFGFHRMKVLELFAAFASTRYVCLLHVGLDESCFSLCFDLFFRYPWNNFLHNFVTQVAHYLLDSQNKEVVLKLYQKSELHKRIAIEGNKARAQDDAEESNKRPGFMGFITIIAGAIQNSADTHEEVKEILEATEEWNTYVEGDLLEIRKIENKPLGASAHGAAQGSDDEDGKPVEFMNNYQAAAKHGFETDFPDDFATGDIDDDIDILFHPDNRVFTGICTDEEGFGHEFDSDSDEEATTDSAANDEESAAKEGLADASAVDDAAIAAEAEG
mmetsp:Transcript_8983/g.37062  ORF Transcript_8983/g.37062 Transcript_8983/m.37062 type:complete len:598 (-) Transcript_8983:68-1861(-)|eukprot:CAMPEP_0114614144 /NCGR_PEP_ID=MMETSP0168-20121206/5498_1 /TAXON_ID=95228 ORGANISM="Vannella sp., Strain DIVA3 517/6/12" /NCGR_SAMPLE_ID=MMETSP0168 /ASSEMBLY_ACC=CAM_ASM_000044 /LENGTH=597 /DNA_ID=CAMNT_0001825175 /DNA_START=119 /DNA_END=1912 /DNA_ORIENTATION=-